MLSRVTTFGIDGIDSRRVTVEIDIRIGLPNFTIIGLGDKAVRESRDRVRPAILNSGFEFPQRRITANLAPAYLRKAGPGFDLALAVAILAASEQVPADVLEQWAVFGELSLTGAVRPCGGVLAVAEGTRRAGLHGLVVPEECAPEAALVDGVAVAGLASLAAVADVLRGAEAPTPPAATAGSVLPDPVLELADVRGHPDAVGGLVKAAAGGHNLLLSGPPGTGKTMLARRLPSILPPLTHAEALEVTRIHSIAGSASGRGLAEARPFRAPHHSISPSGLVGGGAVPAPGEVTLAHNGVLFLDELSEFSRGALEAMRQPLEDGRVAIVRGQRAALFPTRFLLVAATNPCPCGRAGTVACECTTLEVSRYQRRLSGPLLDRIDIRVDVLRPKPEALTAERPGLTSAEAREQVREARERQTRRFARSGTTCNAQMTAEELRSCVRLDEKAEWALRNAHEREGLSARGHHRALRLARTVADLGGRDRVVGDDVISALALRGAAVARAVAA